MKVLIAGGAGYIGSTIAYACSDAGISPVILDSLVTGRREFAAGLSFYQGDIADGGLIDRIFAEHPDIAAVIHCAALIVVPDSVADPIGYYLAHVAALTRFDALPGPVTAINLGSGTGTTVRELLAAFNQVADHPVEAREAPRRPGDVAGAYTRVGRAQRLLGWLAQYDVAEGIRHSLQWAALRDEILREEMLRDETPTG